MNISICPVCASDAINAIYPTTHDYITNIYFQVWKCNNCAIVYTLPRPNDLAPFYPEKYRRYNPIILNILKFLYNLRASKWSHEFNLPGVAFEMGCGDGIMLNALRRQGWQVFGNEQNINMASFARHKLNLPIFVGGIDSLSPAPIADLIILFQVLEHLKDPIGTLKQLNPLMKPNGRLVIAVPNFGGWQAKFGGATWFHLDVPRHLFHFSPQALEFCLKKSGFEITQVSYVSFEHDPYGWVQSILNRLSKKHNLLTRLLMRLDKLNPTTFIHITLGLFIGVISFPITIASWLVGQGAIMEVTARKTS